MKFKPAYLLGLLLAAAASACSVDTLDFFSRSWFPANYNVPAMMLSSQQSVVLPGYRSFLERCQALRQSAQAFQTQASAAGLEQLRSAWRQAAQAWVGSEAFQYGPATDDRINQQIHYLPRREEHIQAVLQATTPLEVKSLGSTRKGLPVIEYLLFGPQSAELTNSQGQRARDYLALLAADLVTQAELLNGYWAQTANQQSRANDPKALNQWLNQSVMTLEDLKNKRLGLALGQDTGGKVNLRATEAPDSQASLELIKANLAGVRTLYDGGSQAQAAGIDDYLISLGHRKLDTRIRQQLSLVDSQIQALEPSLESALKQHPAQVQTLYEGIRELLRYIKVDVAAALNETVHFTDNDGD